MKKTSADQQIRTTVVLAVGIIAAMQSYSHIYDLARAHGQSPIDARLLPLSVDGLIIAASLALKTTPVLARWMLGLGVAATVGANVAYGLPEGSLAAILSAWPGVSFVGSAELLLRGRHTEVAEAPAELPVPAEVYAPVPVPVVPAEAPVPPPVVPPRIPPVPRGVPESRTLAEEFAAEIAARKIPGVKQIQRRMGGSQTRAYKHQAEIRRLAGVA